MTSDATGPLTEEELAAIKRWDRLRGKRVKGVSADCRRLIAEVERLRDKLDG